LKFADKVERISIEFDDETIIKFEAKNGIKFSQTLALEMAQEAWRDFQAKNRIRGQKPSSDGSCYDDYCGFDRD
jgi:hypothetical protein